MPSHYTDSQLPVQNTETKGGGWWSKFTEGLKSTNFTFSSGPQGFSFGGFGGGQNALPLPPSGQDVNNWLPYLLGGVVLFKLLK